MSSALAILTFGHVIISLVGILAGFIVVFGFIAGKSLPGWTSTFLWTTILTSVTGYFFPFHGLTPGHIIGTISLVVLAIAFYALNSRKLAGAWRATYVVTAVLALYLNFFVLIVQAFLKVPALHALAPTKDAGPFKIAQLAALILFVVLGVAATRKFHPEPARA